jgi:alkanesulfonate monooxygenase SsuD/methylene tetrahydromethanopterin reductase-like flavin-dependent oxidoreductase (luciferase family)
LRVNGLAGTPAEVLDGLATWSELGVERVYLQILDIGDTEHIELIGEQVLRLLP